MDTTLLTPDELRQKIAALDPAYARMMLPPEPKPVARPVSGAAAPVEAPEPLVEITPEEALLRIRSARETGEAGEAPVADPVLGRSVEDLVADKWFNPLLYARQFPESMKIPGMREAMEEVYERKQAAIDQNPLKALPDPRDLSWDGVKDTAGMFLTGGFQFLKAHLKGSLGLSTPEEYRRSVATSAAAMETAGLNSVDLLHDARKNPIFVPQQAAARMAQRAVETPEQRQKRISQQFSEDMGWAQVMEEAAQGKGPVTGSAAGRVVGEVITGGGFRGAAKTALGVLAGDEKALEAPGKWVRDGEIELNPEEVMGGAAVLDPINFVPVGAGIGVFTRAGKVLARGPLKGLVRFAERNGLTVRNLPTVHGVTGKAAAAVVGGLEKGAGAWASQQAIRSAAGAGLGFLAGGPVGAMAGLAAEPFTRPALKAIQSAATRFSKGRGLLFGAYDALLRKPVTGATHGLVASYPIAALTTDPEKQRAIISGGIGLGAVGGLLGGAGAAVTRTGEWTGAKLANRLYGDVAREPVQKFSYGTDAALDAAHQKGQARQAQVDRQSGMSHENVIDVLRNRMRYVREADGSLVRVEIYNLAEPDFLAYAGEQAAGAVPRPVLDSNGQPVYRVFLNADASRSARQAIFHEPGHVVTRMLEQLYPEQHKKLMDELNRLDPEALGAFKALYEARRKADLRSQDPNISAEDLEARATLSPEGVYDEAAAELLGAVLRGHSLDGLSTPLVTRVMETVGAFLEGTGIYRPGPGGTETAVGTALEFTPSFRVGQLGREFLRASGVEGGKGAEGAPPTVRPTSTPPPLPTAPPSTPPPLPLAGVTPTAAPGGFGTVPPAIRRTPPAGGATKRGNLYTDRKGQGLMEADWWSDSSWDEALDVVERSNLPPEQKEIFRRIYDYRKTAAGPDLPPIEIDYESVKQTVGTGKPPKRAGRRTDQQIAYLEEAMGRLPEETRELFQKIFLPYRVIIRNRDGALNVNLMAMSPDKVLGNALLALRDAHAKGRSDLVPYENSNGQFTQAGAKQFADDLAVYSSNQAHGYAGSGDPVTIPAGYEGMLPEVDPTYRPQPLSRDRADFVNLSMGIEPPRTGRKVQQGINPKTGKRIETPRNIEAARLAAAQGRPLAEFPLAEGRVFKFKGEEIPIYETNPLRQQFTELGIELDRLLAEVTEEINLENIKGTPAPRPSIRFRQPSTGLVTAGLLPRGPEAIPAVRDMTVADIYAMRGRFTEEAARLGRSLRDHPESLTELESLMPPLEEAIQAKMQGPEKDLQTAVDLATKRQFIRETLEAARDEGSMKGIFEEQPALYVDIEGIRYSKPLAGDVEAMKQPDGPSGTTINSDGTPYQVPEGARLDIVTLASENMPLADLTPERIAQVVAEKGWEPVLTDQNTKLGVFKFAGPDGTPMVSVDLNVLVDQKHRANTVTFAKANNQISAFDLVTFEEIPAGGTGDTVLKEIPDLVNAVGKLTQGEPVSVATVGAKKAPSGALSVTKTVSPPETAAEGAAFLPRDEEYLRAVRLADGSIETVKPRELDWQFEERLTKAGKDLKKAEWGEVDAEGAFRTNDELAEMREPRPWETPEPEIPPARNEEGELQTVVGKPLDLVHLSSREDLRVLDPRKMGKGRASTIDMRGLPKTFFFEKGSPLAGDEPTFPGGESRYTARVSGKTIYDATGADPQRWRSTADRVAADQRLIDAGYSGVRVETEDGRRVVIMFERVPVKLGGKFKGGPVVFLPTSVDSSVMQIVDTMAKLNPAGLTPEFLTGVERAFNVADAEDNFRAMAEAHPEALLTQIQRFENGEISWSKNGVTPVIRKTKYDFENQPMVKRLRKELGAKNEDAILDTIAELGAKHYEEAKNLPAVAEGLKWYSEARQLLKEKFGDDMDMFAQLLAATSPQQPPIPNFLDAFELYTRYRDGELDAALRRYGELLDKWDALEEPRQGETKKAAQARVREYWTGVADDIARETGEEVKFNKRNLQTWLMDKEGILPRRTGTGAKFGISSRAALDALAGKWLERAGGKKTRQFYGNLVGSSFGATVDVWASRWLHRLLNEGETNKRWRIEPLTEMGVQPKDFDFAQKVFKRIADREDMTPDSLQAILWFWEKDTWDKRGWTKGAGAQRQSFIPLLRRVQVTPEGKRVLTAEDVRAVELEAEMARHRKPARLRKKQPDVNQLDLGLKTD